jgi:hypothetical protein
LLRSAILIYQQDVVARTQNARKNIVNASKQAENVVFTASAKIAIMVILDPIQINKYQTSLMMFHANRNLHLMKKIN